jgi:putative RNase toxin 44 of polymorphic toxin system
VSVDENARAAARHTPLWFLNQVPKGNAWDYKQRGRAYEPFGNFNYGAAGRAGRLPKGTLFWGAGVAQPLDGTSRPSYGSPLNGRGSLGDDPVDQFWIGQGVRYHDERR